MTESEILEIKAELESLKRQIYQLEQDIKHMAKVGDLVEVEWLGDAYERRYMVVKDISHKFT